MPQAVTHVIIALIIGSLVRDYLIKDKKKFPLHYVLILGIAALLPDIDIAFYWILYWFGFTLEAVHRTFTHNIFVPLAFFILSLITIKTKNKEFGKHHVKLSIIFVMIAFGISIHLVLDATLAGYIKPFYPFNYKEIGLNLIDKLPSPLSDIFLPSLDAALLVLWLIHEEWKHKISDFI